MTAPAQSLARGRRGASGRAASARALAAQRLSGYGAVDYEEEYEAVGAAGRAGGGRAVVGGVTAPRPRRARPAAPAARSPLTVLRPPARSSAPRGPFVVLLLVLMGAGLLSLLLVNTALMENSFRADELQNESARLIQEEQELSLLLDQLSDPAQLAARATQLGMVRGGVPEYLPPGAELPEGARLLDRGDGSGTLVVIPADPPAGAAGSGQGTEQQAAADTAGTDAAGSAAAAAGGTAGDTAADTADDPAAGAAGADGGEAGTGQ